MNTLISFASRIFLIVAFILAALAVWEKILNVWGAGMFPDTKPLSILQAAGVIALFSIALQLHEIRDLKRHERWRKEE
ncbi:MAG: hypothetical protein R3C71_06720 [Candidatus Krumholzibacteriia bacterium]|nr:hypothetical protein [bacterium]